MEGKASNLGENIIIDFGDICRICLAENKELVSLYECFLIENRTISSFIETVSSVKMQQNDGFPSLICTECLQNVNQTYTFIQQCKESDAALKDCYQKTLFDARSKCSLPIGSLESMQLLEPDIHLASDKSDLRSIDHEYALEQHKLINDEGTVDLDLNTPVQEYSEKNAQVSDVCDESHSLSENMVHSEKPQSDDTSVIKKGKLNVPLEVKDLILKKKRNKLKKLKRLKRMLNLKCEKQEEESESMPLSQKLKLAQCKLEEDIKRSKDLVATLHKSKIDKSSRSCFFKYKCKLCSDIMVFSTVTSFIKHQVVDHKRERSDVTTKEIKESRFSDVNTKLKKSELICDMCGVKYNTLLELKAHKLSIHSNELSLQDLVKTKFNKTVICNVCMKIFANKALRNKHYIAEHAKSVTNEEPHIENTAHFPTQISQSSSIFMKKVNVVKPMIQTSPEKNISSEINYRCENCSPKPIFKTRQDFSEHVYYFHKLKKPLLKDSHENINEITNKDSVAVINSVSNNTVNFKHGLGMLNSSCDIVCVCSYVCTECPQTTAFSQIVQLLEHMRLQHNVMLDVNGCNNEEVLQISPESQENKNDGVYEMCYVCRKCEPHTAFKYKAEYLVHQNNLHKREIDCIDKNELEPIYLSQNGEQIIFPNKEIPKVEQPISNKNPENNVSDSRIWKCELEGCTAAYTHKYRLQNHYKIKHDKEVKIYGFACPFKGCGKTFATNKKVIQHGITVHDQYFADFDVVYKKKILLQPTVEVDERKRKYECDICKKLYLTKHILKVHISTHFGKAMQEGAVCSYCGQTLVHKASLKAHIEQKHEVTNVSCPICNKDINLRYLRRHYTTHQLKHGQIGENMPSEKYTCNICNKVLKTKYGFKIHQKSHQNIRDFVCDVCGAAFTSPNGLRIHKNVHAGEQRKVYPCNLCEKVFNGKHTLTRHLLTHSGQKNFICEMCSKDFYTLQELNRHIKYHLAIKQFHCKLCDKKFVDNSALRIHVMRHKNIKPHHCNFCDRKFVTGYKLHLHLQSRHHIQVLNTKNTWKDPKNYIPLDVLLKM